MKIVLTRPTRDYGFDFMIRVENHSFDSKRKRTNPTHYEIAIDLKIKQETHPIKFKKLWDLIQKVYDCDIVNFNDYDFNNLKFSTGLSVEWLLKIIKWMFVEQDMKYWNGAGRAKLMEGFKIRLTESKIYG